MNEEARLYFNQLHLLRSAVLESEEEIPFNVEEKIMYSTELKERKNIKTILSGWFPAVAYASVILLLALSILLFWQMNNYQQRADVITRQLSQQNRTMELILNNSLPPVEVQNQNEIIIRASF
jgi:hypothetical protein